MHLCHRPPWGSGDRCRRHFPSGSTVQPPSRQLHGRLRDEAPPGPLAVMQISLAWRLGAVSAAVIRHGLDTPRWLDGAIYRQLSVTAAVISLEQRTTAPRRGAVPQPPRCPGPAPLRWRYCARRHFVRRNRQQSPVSCYSFPGVLAGR